MDLFFYADCSFHVLLTRNFIIFFLLILTSYHSYLKITEFISQVHTGALFCFSSFNSSFLLFCIEKDEKKTMRLSEMLVWNLLTWNVYAVSTMR